MSSDPRTISEKRLAASRANAQKSTGPKTPEGKQRSAFNSFQHGAFAEKDSTRELALAQANSAGHGPAEIEARHSLLENDWHPASAQQSLLVSDLAWLYWLRDQAAGALVEANARRRARAQIHRDQRRFDARHRSLAVRFVEASGSGCVCLPDCDSKFIEAAQLIDVLDRAASAAQWNSDDGITAPDELKDLYGSTEPTLRGRQVIRLWYDCMEDKAKAADPRVGEIRALLDEERAALAEEEELFRRCQELDIEQPEGTSSSLDPLGPLGETWQRALGGIERLDRQINAKIRLLLRLQRELVNRPAAEGGLSAQVNETPQTVGGADMAPLAMSADAPASLNPALQQNAGTNPSEPLESTKPDKEALRTRRRTASGDAAAAVETGAAAAQASAQALDRRDE